MYCFLPNNGMCCGVRFMVICVIVFYVLFVVVFECVLACGCLHYVCWAGHIYSFCGFVFVFV